MSRVLGIPQEGNAEKPETNDDQSRGPNRIEKSYLWLGDRKGPIKGHHNSGVQEGRRRLAVPFRVSRQAPHQRALQVEEMSASGAVLNMPLRTGRQRLTRVEAARDDFFMEPASDHLILQKLSSNNCS